MNLAHLVEQQARRLPDHPAFIWGDATWNWQAFDARVKAMAAVLATEGEVQKGDRVLVQSQNCNQLFESMFACFRLGAIWVPANFRGMPSDLAWMAELSAEANSLQEPDRLEGLDNATCKQCPFYRGDIKLCGPKHLSIPLIKSFSDQQ